MKRIKTRTNQYATVARNGSNIKNGKHRRAENKRAARACER